MPHTVEMLAQAIISARQECAAWRLGFVADDARDAFASNPYRFGDPMRAVWQEGRLTARLEQVRFVVAQRCRRLDQRTLIFHRA